MTINALYFDKKKLIYQKIVIKKWRLINRIIGIIRIIDRCVHYAVLIVHAAQLKFYGR